MELQKDRPEFRHGLGQVWHVQFRGPDPGCLLNLLIMLAQRYAVLVPLREPECGLGVRDQPGEAAPKKLARSTAAANTSSRNHSGSLS